MADRTLTVKIIGDERDLLRAFRSSTNATQRFSIGAGSVIKSAFIFEGVRAGINAVSGALRAGIAEFSEQQKVAAQTNAAIKSTGGIANVTASDVTRLAGAIQNLSGIDDELVASGSNLLLTFKNVRNELGQGNQVFDRATKAAVDLSVAGFGAIDTTAKQLGKALNDPVRGMTALARAGVTFTEKQRDSIKALVETNRMLDAQKLILREVESQVGGSAKALGDTLPGQLTKLREAFRNAFGNLVGAVAEPLARVLGSFANFIPEIEQGVQRISAAVGPALSSLVDAFTSRLPELQRISSSILEPLRQHVFPVVREVVQVIQNMWASVIEIFDANSGNLRNILSNLGESLAAIWTVARPTIVFLFEKVIPAAFRITIPVIEKMSDIVRVLAEVFTRSVSIIVKALDNFLGGLSLVADAASHLPFIGDSFKGVSDQINVARENLRSFAGELDALNGKKVVAAVGVELPGQREEGAAANRRRALEKEAEDDTTGARQVKSVTKVIESRSREARQITQVAKVAAVVTRTAKTAAEKQREEFDKLMETLGLRRDRAEATAGLQDDLRAIAAQERALRAQVDVEGRTVELERQLFDLAQERNRLQQQQRQLQRQQRQGRQFEAIGLTREGDQRTPSTQALQRRLGSLRDQLKGTALDTGKTRSELAGIARVLAGQFGAVGKEVRSSILQMFNDIAAALNEGSKESDIGGEFTRGGIRSTQQLLKGLNLTQEQAEELRRRNLGIRSGSHTSAFGFAVGSPLASSTRTTDAVPPIHVHFNLDGREMGSVVLRDLQKRAGRSSSSRRGRHGGKNLGVG
ncbi:MAG: phage tail length tape measure family protein [Actinobacteria bacterium]|nr:phage tail length tape measure family protein [Actinomycetota bacterium]